MIKSNLSVKHLDSIIAIAKEIETWIGERSNPKNYKFVKDLTLIRNFVHTLDLLETVLTHFALNAYLSKIALRELEKTENHTLGWEFWQIDIEHYFAASSLELCYQLSNAWKELEGFGRKNRDLKILKTKYCKPSDIILARHKTSHFKPEQFQCHKVSSIYSILRRPYEIKDGCLVKELAGRTMHKVASQIKKAIEESFNYIKLFKEATFGEDL